MRTLRVALSASLLGTLASCQLFQTSEMALPSLGPAGAAAPTTPSAAATAGVSGSVTFTGAPGAGQAGAAASTPAPTTNSMAGAAMTPMSAAPTAPVTQPQAAAGTGAIAGSGAAAGAVSDPLTAGSGAETAGTSSPEAAAGSAATPPVAGASAEVPPGGLQCPAEVCEALPPLPAQAAAMGLTLELCCTPEGQCGTSRNGGECQLIPDSDPQCPQLELMGFKIASCCTPEGRCGLNGKAFMMKDCGSLEEASAMYGGFITFPEPRACTPAAPPATPAM